MNARRLVWTKFMFSLVNMPWKKVSVVTRFGDAGKMLLDPWIRRRRRLWIFYLVLVWIDC